MSQSVQVMVRLRPANDTEKSQGSLVCVAPLDDVAISVKGDRAREHSYDRVFGSDATQEEVFNVIGQPTITNVLKGYNGTVLAYGQTGSGKTHTMLGPGGGNTDVLLPKSPHFRGRGLIPRLAEQLFTELDGLDPKEVEWTVTASVFELYKEMINDSLSENPLPSGEYRIREDLTGGRGVYVDNLYAKKCTTASELLEAIRVGASRRKVASTKANDTSSRSHSITVIAVEQVNKVLGNTAVNSRLTLVDLAGSEKVGKTQAGGERLKEAQMINLSLTLLGNVIFKLTDGKSHYIPYRDSKLTRLLQDSLGGNSMTTLLCCGSPAEYNREETISTLTFAARAKQIKNKPRVNRDLSTGELKGALAQALEEITMLKDRLAMNEAFLAKRAAGLASPRMSTMSSAIDASGVSAGDANDDGDDTADRMAEFERTITRLLDEIEDYKKQLFAKTDECEHLKKQVDFHRDRANDAESLVAELQAKLKREEQLFARKLAEVEARAAQSPKRDENKLVDMAVAGSAAAIRRRGSGSNLADPKPRTNTPSGTTGGRGSGARRPSQGKNAQVRQPLEDATAVKPAPPATGSRQTISARDRVELNEQPNMKPVTPLDTRDSASVRAAGANGTGMPLRHTGGAGFDTLDLGDGDVMATAPLQPTASTLGDNGGTSPVPDNTDLLLRIEALESELAAMRANAVTMKDRLDKADARGNRLQDALEATGKERDDAFQTIDELKVRLTKSDKENSDMKRILDALNIDVEEQLAMLNNERQRNSALSEEARRLQGETSYLKEAQAQQEFCDMAMSELVVKGEDMEVVENEVVAIRFSRAPGDITEATRISCLQTVDQLDQFLEDLINQLRPRTFATGNLETYRLNVISDASELHARAMIAKHRLQEPAT